MTPIFEENLNNQLQVETFEHLNEKRKAWKSDVCVNLNPLYLQEPPGANLPLSRTSHKLRVQMHTDRSLFLVDPRTLQQ